MLKAVMTTAGVALALSAPALAGSGPWSPDPTIVLAQADTSAQGTVRPQVEAPSGQANTGAVTQTAREALPDVTSSDGETGAQARGPQAQASAADVSAGGAQGGVVPPELVEEVRLMALEAERNAPKPPTPTEEEAAAAKQAEQAAIESHRERFFASE